jgi:hypothetical protein
MNFKVKKRREIWAESSRLNSSRGHRIARISSSRNILSGCLFPAHFIFSFFLITEMCLPIKIIVLTFHFTVHQHHDWLFVVVFIFWIRCRYIGALNLLFPALHEPASRDYLASEEVLSRRISISSNNGSETSWGDVWTALACVRQNRNVKWALLAARNTTLHDARDIPTLQRASASPDFLSRSGRKANAESSSINRFSRLYSSIKINEYKV